MSRYGNYDVSYSEGDEGVKIVTDFLKRYNIECDIIPPSPKDRIDFGDIRLISLEQGIIGECKNDKKSQDYQNAAVEYGSFDYEWGSGIYIFKYHKSGILSTPSKYWFHIIRYGGTYITISLSDKLRSRLFNKNEIKEIKDEYKRKIRMIGDVVNVCGGDLPKPIIGLGITEKHKALGICVPIEEFCDWAKHDKRTDGFCGVYCL